MLTPQRALALFVPSMVRRPLTQLLSSWLSKAQLPPVIWRIIEVLNGFTWIAIPNFPFTYHTYKSPRHVELYWKAAEAGSANLRSSNAANAPEGLSLVTYYTPKLLPVYREPQAEDLEEREEHISPKLFCKWHRMVHPGPLHPTLREAEHLIKHFSARDRREMKRIARLETDKAVFSEDRTWTPRYRHQWKTWLETKGPDTAIVFTTDII